MRRNLYALLIAGIALAVTVPTSAAANPTPHDILITGSGTSITNVVTPAGWDCHAPASNVVGETGYEVTCFPVGLPPTAAVQGTKTDAAATGALGGIWGSTDSGQSKSGCFAAAALPEGGCSGSSLTYHPIVYVKCKLVVQYPPPPLYRLKCTIIVQI